MDKRQRLPMMNKYLTLGLWAMTLSLCACNGSQANQSTTPSPTTDSTSLATDAPQRITPHADSVYSYIAQQVAFGPRVPGSEGHRKTGDWIVAKLRGWGYEVIEQPVDGTDYHGKPVRGRNIIATRTPDHQTRFLLMAHWDTRPVADMDADHQQRTRPILGADDGGSGVALLLEMARQWQEQQPEVGLDFAFFDLEDGGRSGDDESWCQGSRFWAQHPHRAGYRAQYGILLDMVGARGARFYWEYHSLRYAAPLVKELWATARELGWSNYFIPQEGTGILDDHVPVIEHRGIPSVDIVNYDPRGAFGKHWHTHADNLDNIDRETLTAVGETVMTTLARRYPTP